MTWTNFLIVDAHTHSYPSKDKAEKIITAFTSFHKMEPKAVGECTTNDILRNMENEKIDYTVLANFAPLKVLHENNLWTLSEGEKHKNLIPLISVHPDMPRDIVDALKQYIKLGAKAIKFHTEVQEFIPNTQKLSSVYTFCNNNKFPIVYHCGATSRVNINQYSNASMILPIIETYPNIPIVLTHMAEGKTEDVLEISQKYKNVYFDTSITITGKHCIKIIHNNCWENDDFVVDMIHQIGHERIMFGSDYPFGSPIDDVNRILRLNLSTEEKSDILGENAHLFYRI